MLARMTGEPDDRRRRKRISTMILCEIRVGEQPPEVVRVRDLAETGIKIATGKALLLGDRLRVRLPGVNEWTLARVVWCSKGLAGLSFGRAIDLPGVAGARSREDLRRPARQAPPQRIAS